MASEENQMKQKLNMDASKVDSELSRLHDGSKLLEFVDRGQISDIIDILKVIPRDSKSINPAFLKATELGHKRILQNFIESGASVNAKNTLGNTPLHIACMHGFIDLAKLFVRNGSQVDCQNEDGQTALLLAVEKACSIPLIEFLTCNECCANVNIQDGHGRTALMVAIKLQDLCAMKFLMAHKDIKLDLKDESGKTAFDIAKDSGLRELFSTFKGCFRKDISVSPLLMALKKNSVSLVQSVLHTLSPKEVNTVDASLFSPLMFYLNLKINIRPNIVIKLLQAGAKVNIGSPDDNITPLFLACRKGRLETVKLLVAEGAHVNTQTKQKKLTPLMCACENPHDETEIVKFLLKHKAGVSLTNSNGETALMVALSCKNKSCAEELIKYGAEINDAVFNLAVKEGWHRMLQNVNWVISQGVINEALVLACKENNCELAQFLMEHGAEVNEAGNNVPLILAIQNKCTELFNVLLSFGADVNLKNGSGSFPLIEAVVQEDIFALKNIIKHGAHLNARDNSGYTSLMRAAKSEHLNSINILLDAGADINYEYATDYGDITALNAAIASNKIEAVKLLLNRGANVNQTKYSPLMQTVMKGPELMELLLNHGADPNIQLPCGSTVLINALLAERDHKLIKLLLSFGADPNTKNNNGDSPLLVAAKYSETAVIELLLKSGADITVRDMSGRTALMCALDLDYTRCNDDKVAVLINSGVDVNLSVLGTGRFPLFQAVIGCKLNILHLLLEKGANVDAQDGLGMTALMEAASSDDYEKAKFLIDCNANLDIQTYFSGTTAAMYAASACSTSILKILIQASANINIVKPSGVSVITSSLYSLDDPHIPISKTYACLKLLLSAGAKPDLRNGETALFFHMLIVLCDNDKPEIIYSFIRTGSAPPVVSVNKLRSVCRFSSHHYYFRCGKKLKVTPLLTAMFSRKN